MASYGRIGFLGAGRMACALASGWVRAEVLAADQLTASDPAAAAREHFHQQTGAAVFADNASVVRQSEVLFLAVKPQQMPELLREIKPLLKPTYLLVSVAAGITLQQVSDTIGGSFRIIRVMPNTPALVSAGAAAFAGNSQTTPADHLFVERLFNCVGRAFSVPEKLLDAVTGLSGSGPAFVALIIEALSDGGVRMGLPRDMATQLAAQTLLGSAKMLLETGLHPGQLKDMVASPGGTTIAGVHALERAGLRGALIDAVEAATRRAIELGKA